MKRSKQTSKAISILWILRAIDVLLIVAPVLIWSIVALCNNEALAVEKVSLVGCIAVALVIVGVNFLMKLKLRSPIWIVLIGLTAVLKDIMPLVITVAVCTLLDELVVSPLINKYKIKVESNKVVDERLGAE